MTWQLTPYSGPLLLSTLISTALTVYIWRRRHSPGATYLFAVMSAVVVWSLGYLLQMTSVSHGAKYLWTRVEFLGIVAIPTLWLAFALDYTGRGAWLRRYWPWLAPVPLVTVAVLWTNPVHGWFWRDTNTYTYGGSLLFGTVQGPAFWAHALYSYVLLAVGNVVLLFGLVRTSISYRAQFASALLGSLAPWVANALTIFDLVDLPHLDLTPFAFCASGLFFGWGLFRYQLLDLTPVTQDFVMQRMRDSLLLLDDRGRIVYLNTAARDLLGRGDDAIGASSLELMPPLSALFVQGRRKPRAEAVIQWTHGGHHRFYQGQLVSLREHDGRYGYLIELSDITVRMRTEERLRELKEAADAASRAKSRFLAHMNHELRNPLTAVTGSAEMLQLGMHGELSHDQRQAVDAIALSSEQLLAMINETLDMARLESGRTTYTGQAFDVAGLVQEVAGTIRSLVEGKGVGLRVEVALDAGKMHSDRAKVQQALLNLLINAAKFTEAGEVEVCAERIRDAGQDWIHLRVRDSGIGIAEAQHEAIFEAFSQASEDTASRFGGTGLGLGIARSFARGMGGDIGVQSRPGEGSTFTLRLPARMPAGNT